MDNKDMDYDLEVPDTPDRVFSQHINCNNPSASVKLPDSAERGSPHRPRDRDEINNRIGRSRRLSIRPPRKIGNGSMNCSNPIVISPSDNSHATHYHLPRKLKFERTSGNEQKCSFGALDMDGVVGSSSGSSYKSYDCSKKGGLIDLSGGNAEDSHTLPKSVQALSKPSEEKANGSIFTATCSSMRRGKEIDLSGVSVDEPSKRLSQLSRNIPSTRLAGQKRLVRNGCISPHNIASKAKELSVKDSSTSDSLSQMNIKASNGSPSSTQVDKLVAEVENRDRIKGKGILSHPCASKEPDTNLLNMSTRKPSLRSHEESKGTGNAAVDIRVGYGYENQGGWRNTRNQPRGGRAGTAANTCESLAGERNYHCESKSSSRSNCDDDKNSHIAPSRHAYKFNRVDEPQYLVDSPNTMSNHRAVISTGESRSSRLDSDKSKVMFVDSSEESPGSSSVRLQNHLRGQAFDSVIEIDESSPEMTWSRPLIGDHVVSPNSDARVRQMEADEMLARELQQQLYNESPMDEYIVQMLQQAERNHTSPASTSSHRPSVLGGSTATRSQRQLLPRPSRNIVHRRGRSNNTLTRTRPTRRSSFRRSSTLLSREGGLHFPLDMDLDMRIDILEALEATIGDFDDIATSGSRILQTERNFNENDYEMLLALDENVHRVGMSSNQINRLPESKVQTDVSEEACSICLENPKFGETIRHLPCLHKFHKDCIDPWLSRSTSCPVCKSSVT